jgi:hypothetical protein
MVDLESIFKKKYIVKTLCYLLAAVVGALASMYLFPLLSKIRQERLQATIGSINQKDSYKYNISDVLRSVKHEMLRAQNLMVEAGERPMFKLEKFDLELKFVIQSQVKGGTQFKLPELLVLSDQSMVGSERVQTIHLEFSVEKGEIFQSPVQPIPPELDSDSEQVPNN